MLLAAWLAPAPAHAQPATPLDRFEPAPAGDDLLAVPSAGVTGHLLPAAGFALSYARAPLVVSDGSGEGELGEAVDHQLVLHNLVSVELLGRLKIEIDVPLVLSQGGDGPSLGNVELPSPDGAALADLRIGARAELIEQDGWVPSAAVGLTGWLPTGDDGAYASAGVFRYAPSLTLSASYPSWAYAISAGRRVTVGQAPGAGLLGSEMQLAAGVVGRIDRFQLGPEVYGSTVVDTGTPAFSRRSTNLEALGVVRVQIGPVVLRAAAGPGLATGAGTPSYRLVFGAAYAPSADDFGALHIGSEDWAPDTRRAARRQESGDSDGDGVDDVDDACPSVLGDASPAARRRGCPPDGDGDGAADTIDACPTVAGVRTSDARTDGCPGDRDRDGVIDPDDACPDDAGEASPAQDKNGCPALVRLVGEQIVILEQVHFDTGEATLRAESDGVLSAVAKLLTEHPEIARIAVDGHTDDEGAIATNVRLSERRALTVVRWLTEHGVDPRRTEARGFGPKQPIADNDTPEGRAKNRRVEFQILLRTTEGEAGWREGPLPAGAAAPPAEGAP